jgi:hypothetical protein
MDFMEKPEGKRDHLEDLCRWEDNIKMDLREVGWGVTNFISVADDRDQCSYEHGNEIQVA